jgi:hypothetical protein
MENLKVVSQRNLSNELGWWDVACDRASVLGNPFDLVKESQREAVCTAYREWLWENIKLAQAGVDACVLPNCWNLKVAKAYKYPHAAQVYGALQGIVKLLNNGQKVRLLCWCKRSDREVACHADVIERCVIWLMS